MTGGGDFARELWIGLCPAALEEHRRRDVARGEGLDYLFGHTRARRPVGVLDVDRQRNAKARYFSTPVSTMPRVKTRWKTM